MAQADSFILWMNFLNFCTWQKPVTCWKPQTNIMTYSCIKYRSTSTSKL